jgi:hypothetical protein
MNLDVTGVNHQPFVIRLVHQAFQQSFPDTFVPPAAKTTMRVFPASIGRRQVSPGRACAQNPEYAIDELPIIPRLASPSPFPARKMRLQKRLDVIRNIVTMLRTRHGASSSFTKLAE